MPKITKCTGEGQGSCKRCNDKGRWNRTWMCFLNEIEGYDGCYCDACTKEILYFTGFIKAECQCLKEEIVEDDT